MSVNIGVSNKTNRKNPNVGMPAHIKKKDLVILSPQSCSSGMY